MAALLSPGGTTHRILLVQLATRPLYVPSILWEELNAYKQYILQKFRKKGISISILDRLLFLLRRAVITVDVSGKFLQSAKEFVNDLKDAPFVALALYLRRYYSRVYIVTYNTDDYKGDLLKQRGVLVVLPTELDTLDYVPGSANP